ncbi:MAG TPA: hypothetical protein VEL31_12640 [Ktedonobacteraceae bacterium]|nr:hypothetical protein [Ktedonobacteraceae bacterium]
MTRTAPHLFAGRDASRRIFGPAEQVLMLIERVCHLVTRWRQHSHVMQSLEGRDTCSARSVSMWGENGVNVGQSDGKSSVKARWN